MLRHEPIGRAPWAWPMFLRHSVAQNPVAWLTTSPGIQTQTAILHHEYIGATMHQDHAAFALTTILGLLLSGCGRGDDTCDPTDVRVASPTITQGFAGFGSAPGDVSSDPFGSVPCSPGLFDLVFVAADAPPENDQAARALLESDAEQHAINTGVEGYELAVASGSWLACLVDQSCHLVVVQDDAVTSVHVRSSIGLARIFAFNPEGEEALGRGYDIAPVLP